MISGKKTIATMPAIPRVVGNTGPFESSFRLIEEKGETCVFELRLTAAAVSVPPPLSIRWTQPATNVKGVWSSGALYEKRLRADWEEADVESRISVNAPAISVFGHQDENRLTFAWSDAINTANLAAPVREEDNLLHCRVDLFQEGGEPVIEFVGHLRIDLGQKTYCEALQEVGHWWEQGMDAVQPVPDAALEPIYSTWYNFHQEIDPEELLSECRIASELGYKTIIVDDGWQTMDNQRGYDYTGDWLPERFTEMTAFVDGVHACGMKAMIWYSVPFCGPKSKAYQRFKGKLLTRNHRWAPVFDPRYPEVRDYLVSKYANAIKDWQLDGLKLDFIDDFRMYPETPLGKADGRDCANVNEGVSRLIRQITTALQAIKPDLIIEFRQKYIGPELRRIGNLFRAFDCPNDSATNRLRTTDVRLIGGSSKVTADMVTWHPEEPTEIAALQLNNVLFSVPQLSVRLREQSADKLAMIRFWTAYYNENREVLMGEGLFRAHAPLENYPLLSIRSGDKMIIGLHGSALVELPEGIGEVDVINGKLTETVLLKSPTQRSVRLETFDCLGEKRERLLDLQAGVNVLSAPPSGLLRIRG